MIDYINNYVKFITGRVTNGKLNAEDKNDFLIHIQFIQHERLIHLLVMILFAMLLIFGFIVLLISFSWLMVVFTGIIFIVEIFYIIHYYRLENGVQKMYRLYDELTR